MPSANDVLGDAQDAFDNLVTDRTNVLDLASHYPYSPERWRLSVDGSRVFPEYGSVPQYTHATDTHDLSPAAGETVTLESAERPRYVVQYELAATWAFAVNQSLQGADRVRIGLYDGSNGWYLEHRGDHADDTTADLVCERGGNEVYRQPDVDIHTAVTTFARLKLRTGWYRVTRQSWERSYPDGGRQRNVRIGGPGVSSLDAGPETGNLPIHVSVSADAGTSGLTLSAGSSAQVNLGTTSPLTRVKTAEFTSTVSTAGAWVPIHAFRVDPAREIVNTQLRTTDIVEFTGTGDIRVMPRAFALSNLTDGGGNALVDGDFSTPPEHSATNSVVESTTAVGQFPDESGTVGASTADPGGYQLGFASWWSSGSGSKTQTEGGTSTPKQGLYRDDVCVFLAKAENTGDVSAEYVVEMDF